ncbi:VOC family protein [Methanoculleus taiwanensis]|uniref:VOC family protein n=1 Tax=Methanoculleus taiwanensis TaxID=1550565 RepID=UPI000FFEEE07|nr:VOC family protein [Methanoculleus taiwanensis]
MRRFPLYSILSLLLLISVIGTAGCSSTREIGKDDAATGVTPENAWRIDHAVIVVQNLTASADTFGAAGFNVVPGGDHVDNVTHNALIPFKDGSYLELFAPVDPTMAAEMHDLVAAGTFDAALAGADQMQKRFMRHLAEGTGPGDCAILPSRAHYLRRTGGGRAWWLHPCRADPDVPDGNVTAHPNGAAGIRSIEIAARDPAAVVCWYDTVLLTSPAGHCGVPAAYTLDGSVPPRAGNCRGRA